MKLRELVLVGLVAMAGSGCFVFRAGMRGMSAFVSTPREVVKTKVPVTKDARLAVVWVGHATALVQIDGRALVGA